MAEPSLFSATGAEESIWDSGASKVAAERVADDVDTVLRVEGGAKAVVDAARVARKRAENFIVTRWMDG